MYVNAIKSTTITLSEEEIKEIVMNHLVEEGYSADGIVQLRTKKDEKDRTIIEAEYSVEECV